MLVQVQHGFDEEENASFGAWGRVADEGLDAEEGLVLVVRPVFFLVDRGDDGRGLGGESGCGV